jgi:plastocyanin
MTSMAVAAVAFIATPAIAAPDSARQASATVTIKVTAKDFSFALSKAKVKAGTTVIFKMVNKGTVVHDFEIVKLHKKTAKVGPGKTTSVKVKFAKKGSYHYICTLPRHAELGMNGNFKVT